MDHVVGDEHAAVPWDYLSVEHAHFGRDDCSHGPYLVLTVEPIVRDAAGHVDLPAEWVSVVVDFENVEGDPQILEGEHPANFEGYGGGMHWTVPGTITFHEPFVLGEDAPVLSARVTASAPDWEFVVDVIAERCDEIHTCSCPCE
jgi:hypothetical protein